MRIHFPTFPGPLGPTLQLAFNNLQTALMAAISKDEAAPRILLSSPNGTVYSITVSDAGVVTTVAISGKTREI
jgi:hypothetical protein